MFKYIALFCAVLAVAFAAPQPGVVGYAGYSAGYVAPAAYSGHYAAPVAAAYSGHYAAPVAAAYAAPAYAYGAYNPVAYSNYVY